MPIRDVAHRAGVSVGTASNVLAGKDVVAPATRARVLAAADELGYRPRPRRAHAAGNGGLLGFLVRALADPLPANDFYAGVLHGAQSVCARAGHGLIHELVPDPGAERARLPLMVARRQVAGILAVGWMPDDLLDLLVGSGIPIVLVDYQREPTTTDVVVGDDERGAFLATNCLLELGHLDPPPACIMGQARHSSLRDRLRGFRRAVAASDATTALPEAFVRRPPTGEEADMTHGVEAMRGLLALRRPPTAVFCVNDTIAAGALRTLRDAKVAVPDEVSLVGYDDIPLAAHTVPPLTTVRVEPALLGAQAARHLLERIAEPGMALRHTRVLARLVERGSTGPPPGAGTVSLECEAGKSRAGRHATATKRNGEA